MNLLELLPAGWKKAGECMVIKKSVRIKKRYVKFRCISEEPLQQRVIEANMRNFILRCMGFLHNPYVKFVRYDAENGEGVLKCSARHFKSVLQSLVLFKEGKCRVKLLSSSGTLKKL